MSRSGKAGEVCHVRAGYKPTLAPAAGGAFPANQPRRLSSMTASAVEHPYMRRSGPRRWRAIVATVHGTAHRSRSEVPRGTMWRRRAGIGITHEIRENGMRIGRGFRQRPTQPLDQRITVDRAPTCRRAKPRDMPPHRLAPRREDRGSTWCDRSLEPRRSKAIEKLSSRAPTGAAASACRLQSPIRRGVCLDVSVEGCRRSRVSWSPAVADCAERDRRRRGA